MVSNHFSSNRETTHSPAVLATAAERPAGSGRRSTKGRKFGPRNPHGYRRPSRARAESMPYVLKCVPANAHPSSRPMEWLRAVEGVLIDARNRSDFRASVLKVCRYLLTNRVHSNKYLTSPSWKKKHVKAHGFGRTTFYRVWQWLLANSFLGKVAHGREFDYKPKSLQKLESEQGNDKAVYVLAMPTGLDQEDAQAGDVDNHVDVSGTLPPEGGSSVVNPLDEIKAGAAPQRQTLAGCFAALKHRLLPALPEVPRGDITAKGQNDKRPTRASQLHFARTLKYFVPALNSPKLSDDYLTKLLRRNGFFDTDWTVNDIIYALDHRPDEKRWGHDGARGIKYPGAWLMYRLSAHRGPDGRPIQSRSQRLKTEQAEARARARITADRIKAEEQARIESLVSGKSAAGIALLRAAIRG